MQSENIGLLMEAMNRAQLAMVPAKKDSENPFFHSKYADLATVWDALLPFRQEGLVLTQCPAESPDEYILLDTQITHTSGQWISSRLKMKVAKNDPQGYGSAITYARRYGLGAMTGLVTELDDDGNAASHPQGKTYDQKYTQAKPSPAQPPTPTVQPGPVAHAERPIQAGPAPVPSPDEGIPATFDSAFVWQIGKTHSGKRIEDIPLDYLEWYLSGKNQSPRADHVAAATAELARVANQPTISALCEAYLENITVSETLVECERSINLAMNDENLMQFELVHLGEAGERKLALLRKG